MACLPTAPPALALRRWLGLGLLVLLCLSLGCALEKKVVESKVGEKVGLPCCHEIPSSESLRNYRVYWQKNTTEVVLAYAEGEKISKHKRYENRTEMDSRNLTLWISPVEILDNGPYQCVVQHLRFLQNPVVVCDKSVALFVTADFSKPNVTAEASANSCESTEMVVRCSSHGGFPKPQISGALNNESVVWNASWVSESSLSPYNVTGKLRLNVTKDVSITCSIEYNGFVKSTSLLLNVEPLPFWCDENGPPNKSFMNLEFQMIQSLVNAGGQPHSGGGDCTADQAGVLEEKTGICIVPTVPPSYNVITASSIIIVIFLLAITLAARYLPRRVCSRCCKPQDSVEEGLKECTKPPMSFKVTSETSSV